MDSLIGSLSNRVGVWVAALILLAITALASFLVVRLIRRIMRVDGLPLVGMPSGRLHVEGLRRRKS